MNERLDLQRITSAILRRWIVVLVVTVASAEVGYLASNAKAPTYEATTSILVGQEPLGVIIENADRASKEQLALTFAELAVRAPVLEPAAAALGIDGTWRTLRSRVTIQLAPHTLLLDLHVTGRSPESAALAADAVADQLVAVTEQLSQYRQVKVGPARADPEPIAPNIRMNTLFAGIIGFVVASALALVLELVRARKKRAFRSHDEVPFLGVVGARRSGTPVTVPDAAASEEAAAILGNLRVACRPNPVRTIVVTGASTAQRSRVATQLATTLSFGGVPAVLVDLDLRDPVIHRLCGLSLEPGVAELLERRGPTGDLLRSVNDYLQVLPAGRPSVNPSLLLSPEAVDNIVDYIGSSARVIVFDVPLTERIAELGLVAERVDAVVLVIRNRLTRTEERRIGEDLTALGVRPSGVVVVRTGLVSRLLRLTPSTPAVLDLTDEDDLPEDDLAENDSADDDSADDDSVGAATGSDRDLAPRPEPEAAPEPVHVPDEADSTTPSRREMRLFRQAARSPVRPARDAPATADDQPTRSHGRGRARAGTSPEPNGGLADRVGGDHDVQQRDDV